jgi:hypothetical protein
LIVEFLVVMMLGGAAVAYGAKKLPRVMARRRLRADMERALDSLKDCLESPELVGIGNVGAVVKATLKTGWQEQLGITWHAERPIEGPVAVKFAAFRSKLPKRVDAMTDLGKRIEATHGQPGAPQICATLAVGVLPGKFAGVQCMVEIMPMEPGCLLSEVLDSGDGLDRATAVRELLAMMDTVLFIERAGYYTRNLDTDNIMVSPDGRWTRFDYDNALPKTDMPIARFERLGRLVAVVFENFSDATRHANDLEFAGRMRVLEGTALKYGEGPKVPEHLRLLVPESTEQFIEMIRAASAQ